MEPTQRINKPMKSEKTAPHYCFSEPLLPLPQREGVSLPTKRLAWAFSPVLAADPSLRKPAARPVCLSGEHMLSLDHHYFLSDVLHSHWRAQLRDRQEGGEGAGHHEEGQSLEGRDTRGWRMREF